MILETQTYEQGLQRAHDMVVRDIQQLDPKNIPGIQALQMYAEELAEEIAMVQQTDDNLLTSP